MYPYNNTYKDGFIVTCRKLSENGLEQILRFY